MAGAEAVFVFATTHASMLGESVLESGGITVRVMAKPDQLGTGCGICLRVPEEERLAAGKLLGEKGAAPERVYWAQRGPAGMEYTECKG